MKKIQFIGNPLQVATKQAAHARGIVNIYANSLAYFNQRIAECEQPICGVKYTASHLRQARASTMGKLNKARGQHRQAIKALQAEINNTVKGLMV